MDGSVNRVRVRAAGAAPRPASTFRTRIGSLPSSLTMDALRRHRRPPVGSPRGDRTWPIDRSTRSWRAARARGRGTRRRHGVGVSVPSRPARCSASTGGSETTDTTARQSMYLPRPEKTKPPKGPLITLEPGAEPSQTPSGTRRRSRASQVQGAAHADLAVGRPDRGRGDGADRPHRHLPAGEGPILQVERFDAGKWDDFPQITVSGERRDVLDLRADQPGRREPVPGGRHRHRSASNVVEVVVTIVAAPPRRDARSRGVSATGTQPTGPPSPVRGAGRAGASSSRPRPHPPARARRSPSRRRQACDRGHRGHDERAAGVADVAAQPPPPRYCARPSRARCRRPASSRCRTRGRCRRRSARPRRRRSRPSGPAAACSATATASTTGTATTVRPRVSISQPPGKKNTMSIAAAAAKISDVVLAEIPTCSAQSGSSTVAHRAGGAQTITAATPSVSTCAGGHAAPTRRAGAR